MIHPDTRLADLGEPLGISLVAARRIPKGTVTWAHDPLDRILPAAQVASLPALFDSLTIRFAYRNAQGDYVLAWDDTRFMNHSCEPTCAMTRFGFEIALRDIEAGEQLTNDYAMLHLESEERIDCGCGYALCRGAISASDQHGLQPVWDAWIDGALASFEAVDQPLSALLSRAQIRDAFAHYRLSADPATPHTRHAAPV
jgi:hypothetical protein